MSPLSRILYRTFSTTPTPTTPSIKQISESLFKERNLTKLAEKFKDSTQHYRFRTKHKIYQSTIRRLAAGKRFNTIQNILEHQKTYPDITKEGFAIRLISLYGKSGMIEQASNTFHELPDLKCARTVKSFNALLTAYIDAKKSEEVEKMFRKLPETLAVTPDEYSYTITIQALCEIGGKESLNTALSLLDEMEKNGLNPNLVTFNNLFNRFYSGGRFLEGERIWGVMEKKGIVPDIRSYNARLRGLMVAGRSDAALELFEEMKKKEGVKIDTFSYNAMIKGYCNEGKLDEAKKVYNELLEDDTCVENRVTYEMLIPALCEKGEVLFALKLCKKSISANCNVNVEVVQGVIEELVKQGKVDDAKKLLEFARSKSYSQSKLKVEELKATEIESDI